MKKQILLPVLLAVFAVGSAFASIKLDPGYYPANDSSCSGTPSVTPPCTVGTDSQCKNGLNQPYYTKPDITAPTDPIENPCEILEKVGF